MARRPAPLSQAALLAALLSLGGCGERNSEVPAPAAPTPTPVAPDPAGQPLAPDVPTPAPAPADGGELRGCELISVAEAAAAAGLPMRVVSPPGTSGCALDSVPPNLTIEVIAVRRTGVFDEIARHASAQPLPGIGDAAFFLPVRGRTMAQLVVSSRGRMLVSTLHLQAEGPDLRAIAERVGATVAPRL